MHAALAAFRVFQVLDMVFGGFHGMRGTFKTDPSADLRAGKEQTPRVAENAGVQGMLAKHKH